MAATGIIAVVLGIVIVMLSVALLIIWFRGNKQHQSLTDELNRLTNDRNTFDERASKLQSKINNLEKNLASAKNSGKECAELTKQQYETINKLKDELQELQQTHKNKISDYESALKKTKESNIDILSKIGSLERKNISLNTANEQLRRENQSLSETNEQLRRENQSLSKARNEKDDLKKRLAKTKEPATEEDVLNEINNAITGGWSSSIAKYIRQNYETVIKVISNEELMSTLAKGPNWSIIIRNIEDAIEEGIKEANH